MNRAVEELAKVYPQLYLTPGEEGAALCREIVRRGADAPNRSLDHFTGSARDSLETESTPAGDVQVITLGSRQDFELFLQIMGYRCVPQEIPATQGASILDGVVNWPKIRSHREAWLAAGGNPLLWGDEFRSFTAEPRNYRDALIVLSTGPYSAVGAEETGLAEEEWLAASWQIRKAHECTHFICRRLFPDRINAIWDELVADAVGLYAAFGRYDLSLAERFLGITPEGYSGGRLRNYTDGTDLDRLARKIHRTLLRLDEVIRGEGKTDPYSLAIRLEDEIGCWTDS